jgi:hypothetical protein
MLIRRWGGGDREHSAIAASCGHFAVYYSALPTRSPSTITTAATPSPSAPNARPPRRAGPPATGGGRDNQRFGSTALPISRCMHSIALPTRSGSIVAVAATPSSSAPQRSTASPRACPPATGGGRDKPRRVASVGLHHGDGLVKPCWYQVSVTLRPLGRPRSRFWPRAARF